MKENILRVIPTGSTVPQARAIMEQCGCQCVIDSAVDGKPSILRCGHQEHIDWAVIGHWTTSFEIENDVVKDVTVKIEYTGL